MLDLRYFAVPRGLQPYVERAVIIDFTHAVGFRWQFFPTGCYGFTLLVGPPEHDNHLERPDDDGALSGIAGHAMGTWCERACLAFGVSLTPWGAAHLPMAPAGMDQTFAVPNTEVLRATDLARLRSSLRAVPAGATAELRMAQLLRAIEHLLRDGRPAYGRVAALAEVAHRMRAPLPPSVEQAAARAGLQRRQFERDFRRVFCTSPKRYATVSRVQQVPQLAWRGMPLARIAAELGFADQAHMTRSVTEVTGMTPAAWLRAAEASPVTRFTRQHAQGRITHL
ncbi:MAG: helix-turn-helix transcriptional regulator [Burkholderiaceae bacterium]|jgi:AraC-like DNA-binding protein|nr:helix-turn-helix transcriptional regulator [Burkholderiaceae bacterium]